MPAFVVTSLVTLGRNVRVICKIFPFVSLARVSKNRIGVMSENAPRVWQYGQEHMDTSLYTRYHSNVYLPKRLRKRAIVFLPAKGTELPLSEHYAKIKAARRLPDDLYMPHTFDIVDVTVITATQTVFRVLIRAPWNHKVDICLALEGDFEVCTAFWASPNDTHWKLDTDVYVQPPESPPSRSEQAVIDGMEEAIRQSRPDDVT